MPALILITSLSWPCTAHWPYYTCTHLPRHLSQHSTMQWGWRWASPPKVERPHVGVLWVLWVSGLGVSSSHTVGPARLLEFVAFGRIIAPYSLVSSSLVEGTQAPVPYQFPLRLGVWLSWVHVLVHFRRNSALQGFQWGFGACRVPHPRSGQVPDIFCKQLVIAQEMA